MIDIHGDDSGAVGHFSALGVAKAEEMKGNLERLYKHRRLSHDLLGFPYAFKYIFCKE